MNHPQVIFGSGLMGQYEGAVFNSGKKAQGLIDILHSNNFLRLDTARRYPAENSGTSEKVLGECNLKDFTIDTKVWSTPGKHQPAELRKSVAESLEILGIPKINVLYLHFPDLETPFEDMLSGITALHTENKFTNFGLSNFTIAQIKKILSICDSKGYLKPSVYQGQYNALARDAENELLPFLRQHDIAFVAYSPAAGGAFNTDSKRMVRKDLGGDIWRKQYGYENAVVAMEKVRNAAQKHNLTGHAVALRWTLYHSALRAEKGDAIVITTSKLEQLQPNLDICRAGPLPGDLVTLMEELWELIKDEAPKYSIFA